jgi:hypothetical protein
VYWIPTLRKEESTPGGALQEQYYKFGWLQGSRKDISYSLCVTSTRIPTTHHIILAAPDESEHSETEIRLVSLDKDVPNVSRNPGASRRPGFCRPRHSGRN